MKYGTKIFFGTYTNSADLKFNEWSKNQSDIEIIDFKYHTNLQHGNYGDHILIIMYKINN